MTATKALPPSLTIESIVSQLSAIGDARPHVGLFLARIVGENLGDGQALSQVPEDQRHPDPVPADARRTAEDRRVAGDPVEQVSPSHASIIAPAHASSSGK